MAKKELPYSAMARAAVQHADTVLPARDATTTPLAVWGVALDAFKAGARFGYRLAKAKGKK